MFHELPGAAAIDEGTEAMMLGTAVVHEVRCAMSDVVAAAAAALSDKPAVREALTTSRPG